MQKQFATNDTASAPAVQKNEAAAPSADLHELMGNDAIKDLIASEGGNTDQLEDNQGGLLDWLAKLFGHNVADTSVDVIVDEANAFAEESVGAGEGEGIARADARDIRRGTYGAVIGNTDKVDVRLEGNAEAAVTSTIANGKPIKVIGVNKTHIEIEYRSGDTNTTGWVNRALFSPQPDLNREDNDDTLQDDYVYKKLEGDLFPEGEVKGSDVEQGHLADCYWVAAMNAVGTAGGDFLRDAITYDASSGMYTVRFYEEAGFDYVKNQPKFKEHYETVDGYLPSSGSTPGYAEPSGNALWGPIYEKAYAQWKGGYDAIGQGGSSRAAMETLTGEVSKRRDFNGVAPEELLAMLKTAQEQGQAVICGSRESLESKEQAPFKGSGRPSMASENGEENVTIPVNASGPYEGKLQTDHARQKLKHGTIKVSDSGGNVSTAKDAGKRGDKTADMEGRDLEEGSIDYRAKDVNLTYKEGRGPQKAEDLEASFRYRGLIYPAKTVYAWHAYVFESVVDDKIQFYNPWGSSHPDPLTAEEVLTYYSSVSTNKVPQSADTEGG
jgi:hypothetical protein